MSKFTNIIIGIILSALSCGILIFAFETNRSFLHIFLTFFILILPITFISAIQGKVAIFFFSSLLIIGSYICLKLQWYDSGLGVLLAVILGGATHIFRVSKAKTFDAAEYKRTQKEKRNGR